MRSASTCPYRLTVQENEGSDQASCRLVHEISGVASAPLVGQDACAACCTTPLPSLTRINRVIATLVDRLAGDVLKAGGVAGCDAKRAARLSAWARRHLRVEFVEGPSPCLPPRATTRCLFLGDPVANHDPESGDAAGAGPSYHCGHAGHDVTTADGCHRCRDWTAREGRPDAPLDQLVPPPAARHGPRVRRWAVGMTTAPRGLATVDWSIDSVVRAGWEPPHLFEDTPVLLAARSWGGPRTTRSQRVGAWPNFYLGLCELLLREPDADAYLMLQDDALLYGRQDLRAYLEEVLWPGDRTGLVSLYCSSAYARPAAGWHRHEGDWVWGALAFLFPRELARRFLADSRVLECQWTDVADGLACIDVRIGRWAALHDIPIHVPTPSLVQHIGDVSSLWSQERAAGRRRASDFAEC